MLSVKIGPQDNEPCPICDGIDCPHREAMRRLSQLELFAVLYRVQQHLRTEEEEQFKDDIPTEFEKWWHAYTKGQVNTYNEKIGNDTWHAAQDALVELAARTLEKEIAQDAKLQEIVESARKENESPSS